MSIESIQNELLERLRERVAAFNSTDEELYIQEINNAAAFGYLSENIPLIDCPDKTIENTYYFRWWTFRKHWKQTPKGHILSEFLPQVFWSGPYNSINCSACHHLREARWLKDTDGRAQEYIDFFLNGHGDAYSYSMWFASAYRSWLSLRGEPDGIEERLDKLIAIYTGWEKKALRKCGLFWSDDDRDAMEYSISGSGFRPTLNSYMYGEAASISALAEKCGRMQVAEDFTSRAEEIKRKVNELLWDEDFYRTIPAEQNEDIPGSVRPHVRDENRVRELVGYIPWYFDLPEKEKSSAFDQLLDKQGFYAPYGLTTAEQRHPRFLFYHEHECLWNGYVWPFATSQTLTALEVALHNGKAGRLTPENYAALLHQYAASHVLRCPDGTEKPWIDENMHPFTGEWEARKELLADNWNPARGGYERGKDYNHSTFCDLVLSGLFGIDRVDGKIVSRPLIPDDWEYFCVTGLTEKNTTVIYDKTGSHYGLGKGLMIWNG